jgi:hypothetical protein
MRHGGKDVVGEVKESRERGRAHTREKEREREREEDVFYWTGEVDLLKRHDMD